MVSDIWDRVGFTGTRTGLTEPQKITLNDLLNDFKCHDYEMWFHHGDCIGADEQAASIARSLGYKIELHPPIKNNKRAFCRSDVSREPKEYLDRNQDIVGSVDILLACPKGPEVRRSGTWSTIRYASGIVGCYIIWPNGDHEGRGV